MSGKTPAVPQIMPRPLLFRKEFFRSECHVDYVVGLKLVISGQSAQSRRHLILEAIKFVPSVYSMVNPLLRCPARD